MSLLQSLAQGSLFTEESLLQSSEGYLVISPSSTPEGAFDAWTRKMTMQSELGIAREMAGLSEESLSALAGVFARTPRRARTDRLRPAIPAGAALLLAGLGLLLLAGVVSSPAGAAVLQTLAIGCLVFGGGALCAGVLKAFSVMPLEAAHARLGLCTSLLDEQHPWLYKASFVTRDRAADAYRQRILQERGALRGVDYLMMREIARTQDALETTRVARTVAEQLNRVDSIAAEAHAKERRLVSVPNAALKSRPA